MTTHNINYHQIVYCDSCMCKATILTLLIPEKMMCDKLIQHFRIKSDLPFLYGDEEEQDWTPGYDHSYYIPLQHPEIIRVDQSYSIYDKNIEYEYHSHVRIVKTWLVR